MNTQGLAAGLAIEGLLSVAVGVQLQVVPPVALSITDEFVHTVVVSTPASITGKGFCVTDCEAEFVHPLVSITVTVCVPEVETVIESLVEADGLHE